MADLLDDKEKLVDLIVSVSGKPRKEIEKAIQEKKEKFSGILTDSGAAFIIAKELKVDLNLEENISETTKIAGLEEGMNGVDVKAVVKQVFAPKKFEKENKKGVLCSLIVGDDSGEIRLTLWHKDVKKLEELGIEKGSQIYLRNCFVSSYNEKKQLSLGYNGSYELLNGIDNSLPKTDEKTVKLKEIEEGMQSVDVNARIARIYEKKEFEREGRQGSVLNFELVDETEKIKATAWNDLVEEVKKLSKGEMIKVENAYTKKGLNGVELHLGWQARILRNPKNVKLAGLNELIGKEVERKKLSELREGEFVEVKGTVVDLYKGNLYYLMCPKCRKKAGEMNGKFVCSECGEVKAEFNPVIAFELDDGFGTTRISCFGSKAEKLLETNAKELKKKLEKKKAEELVGELKEKICGKELIMQGKVKKNPQNERLELTANEVMAVDALEESKRLLDELEKKK